MLCVGVLPFYPFVLLFTISVFTPKFWNEVSSFSLENWAFFTIYPAAAIGVPALFVSIFMAPKKINEKRWLRNLIIAGLIGGSITAVTFLSIGVSADFPKKNWHSLWTGIWQIGGPLVVAFWNMWRLWKEQSVRANNPELL